jgi:hypothetical protein
MIQLSINKINQGENMKQTQKIILLSSTLAFMIFTTGCEIYDCEAAETEATALGEIVITSPTMDNCTAWIDKMKEYDDEGCGETESGANDINCAEFVCQMQEANFMIYGLSMLFSFDSTTYCTYYDSTGMAMQELVNAGGCASYSILTPGVAVTQAMVDEYTSSGCDWGDSTTVNSVIPGQGRLTKVNIKGSNELIKLEELLDQIPDNYSSPMIKRLNRILAD